MRNRFPTCPWIRVPAGSASSAVHLSRLSPQGPGRNQCASIGCNQFHSLFTLGDKNTGITSARMRHMQLTPTERNALYQSAFRVIRISIRRQGLWLGGALVVCRPTRGLLMDRAAHITISICKICLFHQLSPSLPILGQTRPRLCPGSTEKSRYVRSKCPLYVMRHPLGSLHIWGPDLRLQSITTFLRTTESGQERLFQLESTSSHGTSTTTSARRGHAQLLCLRGSVECIECESLLRTLATSTAFPPLLRHVS